MRGSPPPPDCVVSFRFTELPNRKSLDEIRCKIVSGGISWKICDQTISGLGEAQRTQLH
jgi:hypothetical protein